MNELYHEMLAKHLITVSRPKDGDLLLARLRILADKRNRLFKVWEAFSTKPYNPDWLYWLEFKKGNRC